jgi:hypothetical protein
MCAITMATYRPGFHWNLTELFPGPESPEMHAARQEYEEKLTELERRCALLQDDISGSDR